MTDDRQPVLNLALGMVLIGTVGAAVVGTGLDPVTIVFWRSVFGAIFLLVWCVVRRRSLRGIPARSLALGAVAGISLVISWAAFFGGILMTSISTATILFHVQPFLIVLLSAAIWRERITRAQLVWLVLAFVGVVLASNLSLGGPIDSRWLKGVALCLGGALVYAVTAVAGKGLRNQPPEVTTLIQTIAGALLFLPFVDLWQPIAPRSWGLLVMIGVVQTGIAWVLVYGALPRVAVPLIAVLSFVNPTTAILTDWVFFGHGITLAQGAGMGLIVLGTLGVRLGWRPWAFLAAHPTRGR